MRHLFNVRRNVRLNVRRGCWAALSAAAVLLASTASHATPPFLKIKGNALRGVGGALPVFFATRPSADGSKMIQPGGQAAPASIRFKSAPTAGDLAALRALGVVIPLRRDGTPRGRGDFVLGRIPATALLGVAALPRVVKISLDGPAFRPPRPLDGTTREVQATDAWLTEAPEGGPLTGRGITVCDIDSGVDVFHPLFFRADGGHFVWEDRNGDERFTAGVDAIDLDGDGTTEVVQVLNSAITSFFSPEPRFGSEDPSYAIGLDWLYVDTNGSGARDYGRAAGFDDATPTFGERLLVPDDVDGDGELDVGEKLVALGSSKIKTVRIGDDVFRRGVNLVDVPVGNSFAHGTGASAVMVGGNRGYNLKVGIAPDAELVMASELMGGQELEMADFCVEEGARVVLHEYAPWQGYHLDGSSDLEEFIDETTATGVSHINPAGNLSTSQKLYKHLHVAGEETVIDVEAPVDSPYGEFRYIGMSVLWRDPSRALQIVLEDPTGVSRPMPEMDTILYDDWNNGALKIYADRVVSSRGTVKMDMYLFGTTNFPPPIPLGTWKVRVTDPTPAGSPDLEVIGYVQDDLSGWGKGIHFPSFASEDHLIGYPGTADHGLAIAAYTGHDYDNEVPGQRAYYSGRGHRIDGEKILSIAGPDNPITGGVREGSPAAYFVYGGTSGASPHVAGAAALLLQADPARSGRDVREAIRAGALVDDAVGVAPNDDFGYGKLRIYKSLYGTDPPDGSAPTIVIQPVEATAGVPREVKLTVKDADEPGGLLDALSIELDREYDGTYDETIDGPSFTVMYAEPGVYFVKVRVTDATGREDASLAKITVVPRVEEPPDPVAPPRLFAAGGGGCATTPGGGPAAHALGLAAIAILAARRRRRQGLSRR